MIDYSKMLSKTVCEIKPSGIRKFFDILSEMDDVISLTVGQPDFITPWHIRESAIESLEKGKTYYTSNAGMTELRGEISKYMKRKFNLDYCHKNEVVVTVGGSEAIDIAMRTILEPGDEVILPVPSFVCYEPIAKMIGASVVHIDTKLENKFKITPEELKAAITPKTKMLILPFPNNPTGAILTKEELEALAEVLRGTNICVLSDEIYAELTYGKTHVSIASIDGMRERTVIASGFSKAYAMTGWRLGYICAPKEIAVQILKLHQFAIMCAPTMSQFAAIEALKNGDEDIDMMRAEYNRRRVFILEGLRKIGIECFEPEGAFYIYPNIAPFGLSSEEFCERLLYEQRCAIVPGTAFGESGEGFARISYAYSVKHLAEALTKIEAFVKSLKK
ncbi:MAG: aminotransferase class I/II-fold pyridoxal phosphate-dependent enzyme [Ruminococcaceae bacterium]|nr:aminotransferase class I/II-fold pyridoxal phosphate-dependent enzyme [Oscillospiraceae bacterium]